MAQIEWEYKLEGLNDNGQWIETNHYGGHYKSHKDIHSLLQSHLQKSGGPDFNNFRIWKRPKQTWELVLNVAINGEDF